MYYLAIGVWMELYLWGTSILVCTLHLVFYSHIYIYTSYGKC